MKYGSVLIEKVTNVWKTVESIMNGDHGDFPIAPFFGSHVVHFLSKDMEEAKLTEIDLLVERPTWDEIVIKGVKDGETVSYLIAPIYNDGSLEVLTKDDGFKSLMYNVKNGDLSFK